MSLDPESLKRLKDWGPPEKWWLEESYGQGAHTAGAIP